MPAARKGTAALPPAAALPPVDEQRAYSGPRPGDGAAAAAIPRLAVPPPPSSSLPPQPLFRRAAAAPGEADPDILAFEGATAPAWKLALYVAAGTLSGGTLFLAARWSDRLWAALRLAPCGLEEATHVRIRRADGSRSDVAEVHSLRLYDPPSRAEAAAAALAGAAHSAHAIAVARSGPAVLRILEHRCARYLYWPEAGTFRRVEAVPPDLILPALAAAAAADAAHRGVPHAPHVAAAPSKPSRVGRAARYGRNEIVVPARSVLALTGDAVLHPFFLFQVISVIIWLADDYMFYSCSILAISAAAVALNVLDARANLARLAALARHDDDVEVLRGKPGPGGPAWRLTIPSSRLVPGDLVVIRGGRWTLPADVLLLAGEAIVDENMLTGECVPVRKTAYDPGVDGPPAAYAPDAAPRCTLYGGTVVLQTQAGASATTSAGASPTAAAAAAASAWTGVALPPVYGVVARTGFWTAKGQLIKAILYPRERKLHFESDSLRFIALMMTGGVLFYAWSVQALAALGGSPMLLLYRLLDVITVAVPPALPACLTVATALAIARLQARDVFVTDPQRVNLAGQLDVICFDKTGTLTDSGLDLAAVRPLARSPPAPAGTAPAAAAFAPPLEPPSEAGPLAWLPHELAEILACCHGLAVHQGALLGDPLDQKLFEATGWNMHAGGAMMAPPAHGGAGGAGADGAAGPSDGALHLLHRLEFASELQRMLVVVERAATGERLVFVKGAPEVLRTLVDPSSVPADFDQVLASCTAQGLRVLALAARPLRLHERGAWGARGAPGAGSSRAASGDKGSASSTSTSSFSAAAAASSAADVRQLPRAQLESGLKLAGLVLVANRLRPDTCAVIARLQAADLRCVMVTGDHLRTAVAVAGQCGIARPDRPTCCVDAAGSHAGPSGALAGALPGASGDPARDEIVAVTFRPDGSVAPAGQQPPLTAEGILAASASGAEIAVSGRALRALLARGPAGQPLVDALLSRAAVFARMAPDGKRELIELLGDGTAAPDHQQQHHQRPGGGTPSCAGSGPKPAEPSPGRPGLGHKVGFCGDGANDCAALKAALVGLSLCEAEASVAAPLTSKVASISAMAIAIAEGRASLANSFQIFKYMVAYAFIQVLSLNLLYAYGLRIGNNQYIVCDLFITLLLSSLMGYTGPRDVLSKERPAARLLSLPVLVSTGAHLLVCAAFQGLAIPLLKAQAWYVPYVPPPDDAGFEQAAAPENSTLMIVSYGQYILAAIVFNVGRPHRQEISSNSPLLLALLADVGMLLYLTLAPDATTRWWLDLVPLPIEFRRELAIYMLANLMVALLVEAAVAAMLARCSCCCCWAEARRGALPGAAGRGAVWPAAGGSAGGVSGPKRGSIATKPGPLAAPLLGAATDADGEP